MKIKLDAVKMFGRTKVARDSMGRIGKIFIKTMCECDDIETGNQILLAAYILKLKNYFEIEDIFCTKFPIRLK